MAPKKSTDLSAALTGLILGGSVLFLLLLTIVWLTNRHFEGKKAEGPVDAPAATAPAVSQPAPAAAAPAPAPSSGAAAPSAPPTSR
jgi:uncharacterized iron-regulated membrane protein